MLSGSYASQNSYSTGKTSEVLKGVTLGANRSYVLAHCAPDPLPLIHIVSTKYRLLGLVGFFACKRGGVEVTLTLGHQLVAMFFCRFFYIHFLFFFELFSWILSCKCFLERTIGQDPISHFEITWRLFLILQPVRCCMLEQLVLVPYKSCNSVNNSVIPSIAPFSRK